MALFLTREQIYRILQRELPDGAYADGPPSAFFTTADMASVADVAATGYGNLERIYENYFPQTTDEYIGKWIDKMFLGASFEPNVTLDDLRARVIAKVRLQPQINMWQVLKIAASFVPPGTYVQILENCGGKGCWTLGVSRLGRDTFLCYNFKWYMLGIDLNDWCDFLQNGRGWILGVSKLGNTTKLAKFSFLQVLEPQLDAYGYKLRIFDYQVTGNSYTQLLQALNDAEPARSVHIIYQNVSLSGSGYTQVVTNVDEFSLVNMITQDDTSNTGYSGRI